MTMYTPGVRVIRGQDWIWGDQDGGIGSSGTVCELGQPGSKRSPDKTVVVCWDSGLRSNYRTGYQGQYDLTVIDNAQCGVRHPNIECNSCKQNGIVGMRYKCTICYDYNLCTPCYHADKHNLDHSFLRYDSPISSGIKLTPRINETKIPLRGIFIGASVQRGHDWKWANQDGGEGSTGIVTDICCWGNESSRSVACVKWRDGSKNDYRVGHKGIMDLKYINPAPAGNYFLNHLPILGKSPESAVSRTPSAEGGAGEVAPRLCPGDRVRVALDADTLRHLQQGHGGWNPRMADYIGKVGVVHRVTERGDIRVQHEGCPNRWTFHPAALVAVAWYRIGDTIRVISDLAQVRQLQRQHGEWVPAMESALGKTGRVMNVYSDGDLRIQILDDSTMRMWTLNPQCVLLVQRCPNPEQSAAAPLVQVPNTQVSNATLANSQGPNNTQGPPVLVPGTLGGAQDAPMVVSTSPDRPEMRHLMSKVAQGNLEYVKELYETDKSIIDSPYCGKTLLQVAAYQGHRPLVQFLLSKGAKPTAVDDDGDSVLHDAAFGNQPEILEILLSDKDVDINAVNRSRCTALHIAAHKCLPHCVWVLLQHKPNVNLQDAYGDTALHDAINNQCSSAVTSGGPHLVNQSGPAPTTPLAPPLSGSMRIIQMLCDYPDTNFGLANKRGFNALQHAALKGNAFACAAICRRAPSLVDRPKDDGFSALHLAALNGHAQAVSALVTIGHADLNHRNNRHQSPLLLSISQGHCIVIEQLVKLGCLVTAFDEDGNTALHIAYMKRLNAQSSEAQKPNSKDCPEIFAIYDKLTANEVGVNRVTFTIIIFLILKGCDPKAKNKEGKCIYDLIDVTHIGGRKLEELLPEFLPQNETESSGTGAQSDTSTDIVEITNRHLANVAIGSDPEVRTESPPTGVEGPNSSREGAFGGVNIGVNVNASPSKRNYYNLLNYADLGECSSSNSSPVHYPNLMGQRVPGKANNTSSPQHPVRPSRHKKSASPPSNAGGMPRTKPTECVVCCELSEANCLLEPCGHRPACEDCSARMKKCLVCGFIIERRLTTDGRVIPCRSRQPSAERLRYLECKIQEIEEAHCCPICLERRRTVAFLCGHGACSKCAATLSTCHMCRQDITSKINLY